MDEHQRVDAALRDQPGRDDGLAERGGRRQHAGVVREQRIGRRLLLRAQSAP